MNPNLKYGENLESQQIQIFDQPKLILQSDIEQYNWKHFCNKIKFGKDQMPIQLSLSYPQDRSNFFVN